MFGMSTICQPTQTAPQHSSLPKLKANTSLQSGSFCILSQARAAHGLQATLAATISKATL
jgi:hypothetical protein